MISEDHGVGNGHIIQVLKQISKDMGLDERNNSFDQDRRIHSPVECRGTATGHQIARTLDVRLLPRISGIVGKRITRGLRADVLSSCGCGCVYDKHGVSLHTSPEQEEPTLRKTDQNLSFCPIIFAWFITHIY
jgi:hypothetical protein